MADLDLPVTFRSDIAPLVLNTVRAGESCSLVGVGSVGKSNVGRHVCRRDVLAHYLGGQARCMLGVLVDCLDLGDYTLLSLYRLMLQSLTRAIQQSSLNVATAPDTVASATLPSQADTPEAEARVVLEGRITAILRSGIDRLYFIFDDFDAFVLNASPHALQSLRSLRDNFKVSLTYVPLTRRELHHLRPQVTEYHSFYELVTATTLPIGPNTLGDALFMIERLSKRWNLPRPLSSVEQQRILELSGRHPGLLKAILWANANDAAVDLSSTRIVSILRTHKDIAPELENIAGDLEAKEMVELQAIAARGQPVGIGQAVRQLERKGLIRKDLKGSYELFSPLLRESILSRAATATKPKPSPPPSRFKLDASTLQVQYDGHTVALTLIEFSLFTKLHQNTGKPILAFELRHAMFEAESPADRSSGAPSQRLPAYMASLVRKINTPQRAYIVRNDDGSYTLREL